MITLSHRRVLFSKLSRAIVLVVFAFSAQASFAQTDQVSQEVPIDRGKLLQEIDAQFLELSEAKRNEDAFSLVLASSYVDYAALLTEAGSYGEANAAFAKALQIQRSNHGINAAEQLPILESLFGNNFIVENIDDAVSDLARVVRIEKENPEIEDRPSVVMQLKLGHYFLDLLQGSSLEDENSAQYLRSANEYFMAVIEQNKDRNLDQALMPYGEVAMANYLGNRIIRKPEIIYDRDKSTPVTSISLLNELRGRVILGDYVPPLIINAPADTFIYNDYINDSMPRAAEALKEYFRKAYAENNTEEALYAAMALGDLFFLVGSDETADEYYNVASQVASIMPDNHPQKLALSQPARLPHFNYAYSASKNTKGDDGDRSVNIISVPLKFDVDNKGRLKKIVAVAEIEKALLSKAKRELRDLTFRPSLIDGARASVEDFVYVLAVEAD